MWKVLKELTSDEAKLSQKNGVLFDAELTTNNKIIAEKFNTYCIDNGLKINNNLPNSIKQTERLCEFKNNCRAHIKETVPI